MNRKPTTSNVNLRIGLGVVQANPPDNLITTPKSHKKPTELDAAFGSPTFYQYSQEEYENFDVVWDWNPSQIKTRPRKHKKLEFTHSPEFTIKRPPSNNQIADFIKLKEELETLKDGTNMKEIPTIDLEGALDDSMDYQLLVCSQEVENHMDGMKSDNIANSDELIGFLTPPMLYSKTDRTNDHKTEVTNVFSQLDDPIGNLADDSFDCLLEKMQEKSSALFNRNKIESTNEFESKTSSIEDEIERKRQEALMKLKSKKKPKNSDVESPIKCSPEEIEKKRLQALAKLQEKKKQEVIERNRLEALKRLEMNRVKRAKQFDSSSISNKLNR